MPRLYEWYIDLKESRKVPRANGVVTNDLRFEDTTFIHTSEVRSIKLIEETETVVLTTSNTEYVCSMRDANFDAFICKDLIPNYESYEKKYSEINDLSHVEEDSVLITLGNNKRYYFGQIAMMKNGVMYVEKNRQVHIGHFQDSVLSNIGDSNKEYSYFPYKQKHVEFYVWDDATKTYIENCGDADLFVTVYGNTYKITPAERKLISPEFAENNIPNLNREDLYKAELIGTMIGNDD